MRKRQAKKLRKKLVYTNNMILNHPPLCPECGSKIVYYERFVGPYGAFCCDDCEWEHYLTAIEHCVYHTTQEILGGTDETSNRSGPATGLFRDFSEDL